MKKRYLVIAIVLFAFVAAGVAVFFRVRALYLHTGLNRFDVKEGSYTWNGKLFLAEDGETALVYHPMERVPLTEIARTDVDLTPYGFEGETFSYFLYNGYALCPDEGYEGLWPVSNPRRFLYRSGEEVWQIDTEQHRAWRVFADSVEGVPEDGKGLLAFSSNGSYALSLSAGVVSVYHTDPMNGSLRIVDVKRVDLAPLGDDAAFVAFTGEKYAAFTLTSEDKTVYAALDCETGEAVLCPTSPAADPEVPLARFFARRPLTEEEEETYCVAWTNLLLGTDTLCLGSERDLELFSLSPEGTHAAARQGNKVWILTADRLFDLSAILEGERVLSVDFPEENVAVVSVLKDDVPLLYCYTVLF